MLTYNELKYYSSLLQKKIRRKEKKFIIEGQRLVNEALKSQLICELIVYNESYNPKEDIYLDRKLNDSRIEKISDKKFLKLCDTKSPQGIVAVINTPNNLLSINKNEDLIVAIEDISDPGNFGTIIRTCDWFGVKSIIVSKGSVDIYNSKVIRSTMGSMFHINVFESENFISELYDLKDKDWEILCSDMDGEDIFSQKRKNRRVLVLNNEAHGPSEEVVKLSDKIITIPRIGKAESLNVASAASVIISSLTR